MCLYTYFVFAVWGYADFDNLITNSKIFEKTKTKQNHNRNNILFVLIDDKNDSVDFKSDESNTKTGHFKR